MIAPREPEGLSFTDKGSRTKAAKHSAIHAPRLCGIVLAGSYHWGDTAFEKTFRGPMLPVAQTPIISYPLHWLRTGGIREAVVCANSATEPVRKYLGDGSRMGMDLKYFEDHIPRGPAGCVRDAIGLSDADVFVIVEGALIPSLDMSALIASHVASGAAVTVVAEIERRRILEATRQPPLSGGIYVFNRSVLADIPDRGYQDIKEGLLALLYAKRVRVLPFEMQGLTPRVLDYATYAGVSRWLIARSIQGSAFLSHYRKIGDRLQHPTAVVDEESRIIGPVIVGPRARVERGALVVGPTTIGAGSHIATGALVSRSLIWEGVSVGAGAAVDCCLLADRTSVGENEQLYASVEILGSPRKIAAKPEHEFAGSARARSNFLSSLRTSAAFINSSARRSASSA
jgi:mannose-1-phosphate guanylyltransferase